MRKPFHSVADVLHSAWAKAGALTRKSDERTDRVLRSTRLEDEIYADLREDDETMDGIEQAASEKLKTFPALSRDVFQSFYSLSPRRNDEEKLSAAARKFNTHILDHVTEQDDYPALKSICEGREMLAYDAATEFTQRAASELDSLLSDLGGDKGSLETLEKLEESAQKWADDLTQLLEQKKLSAEPDEKLDKALVGAANQLESKQRQAEAVARMIDTQLIRQEEQTDALVGAAVSAAKDRAEETLNILSAWSDEPGNLTRCPMNTELLRRVRQSKSLVDISRYLGRFREIFAQGKKNGYAYGRGEKYSLELGNDLSKALTSELAMLATPETTPLFLQKYRTKQIKQYRRREPIFKGVGDIICCLDESFSTEGEPAAWGKAVAMTLLEIAADGKRRFALIHFAGSGSVQTDVFLPGEYTAEDKLRAAETFLNGGTNFETPMRQSLELMENGGFENADVVFLTDGECELPEEFHAELQAEQAARRFTVTGILLDKGKDCFDFSLKAFCQKIYRTSELTGDDIVRALVSDRV